MNDFARWVLVVDDEFGLADVVAELLLDAGYEVEIAINGQLALDRMEERAPDLVLLDLMMPVLDAAGTLSVMRADPRLARVPVVLLVDGHVVADDMGHQAILQKPFSPAALFEVVRRFTGGPKRG